MADNDQPIVIVEIGNQWVKMARVEFRRGGPLMTGLHVEKHDDDSASLLEIIARAALKLKIRREAVLTYLPRQVVNVRLLRLPSTDPREITDMVELQIGKQTPYSRDEIVSGYKILGTDDTGYTRVMLAIIQRSVVRQRYSILEEAGLDVRRMSISTEGVQGWYSAEKLAAQATAGTSDLLLDIDSGYSDFLVMDRDQLVFTRSILLGAEEMTRDGGKWVDRFVQEVERSVEIYRGDYPGAHPGRILLTGAGAHIDGLADRLRQHFKIATEVVPPGRGVSLSEGLIAPEGVSLTALFGAAAASSQLAFDIVPDAVRIRRALVGKARSLNVMGVLIAAILSLSGISLSAHFYFKDATLTHLKQEIDKASGPARVVKEKQDKIATIRQRLDSRQAPVNLMAELHKVVPDSIYLTKIEMRAGKTLKIEGVARTRPAVQDFRYKLTDSTLFHGVSAPNIRNDGDKVIFEVICTLGTAKGEE